jgi:hypothetical protein
MDHEQVTHALARDHKRVWGFAGVWERERYDVEVHHPSRVIHHNPHHHHRHHPKTAVHQA